MESHWKVSTPVEWISLLARYIEWTQKCIKPIRITDGVALIQENVLKNESKDTEKYDTFVQKSSHTIKWEKK